MELLYYPDPRLNRKSSRIERISEQLRAKIPEFLKIMYETNGLALAAPQVGETIRLVVANMQCDPEKKETEAVYINPEIVELKEPTKGTEACLSLPGIEAEIERARVVTVRFTDLDGKAQTRTAENLEARMFQHEIDHLDGILMTDRMTTAERVKWAHELRELEDDFKKKRKRARTRTVSGL